MGGDVVLRETVRFLDRYRGTIEDEVNRRLARGEPPPAARAEIIRRFRSYCRLASLDLEAARPALEGLGGNDVGALERSIELAVDVACLCDPTDEIADALRMLEARFRTGIRRIMRPSEPQLRRRRGRRRALHGGKRVRAAIDRIGDAYMALDLESGELADLNPAAEALLGSPAVTLIAKPFADLVAPQAREAYRQLEARLDADESTMVSPLALVQAGGSTIPVEVSVANHTVSGRRLAIFVARERTGSLHAPPELPKPGESNPAQGRTVGERTRGSIATVMRSILGPE